MPDSEEILINIPISVKYAPQVWNWTKHIEYARNITKHHIEIQNNEHDDDNVRSIVIVCVGVAMMMVMWIVHKFSKDDRSRRYCTYP